MVPEDGEPLEMASARYSISADRGSVCLQLCQVTGKEPVRRVLDMEHRKDALRLTRRSLARLNR